MPIPGNLLTTAMAVMPHKDVDRALEMAMSLDIPFWPQLPRYSYYVDMYVQASYSSSIKRFLDRGGIISWGIVPTNFEPFEKENMESLEIMLENVWSTLYKKGIERDFLISRSLLSPATCCLVNPDGEKTVEKAFKEVRELSIKLREKYVM